MGKKINAYSIKNNLEKRGSWKGRDETNQWLDSERERKLLDKEKTDLNLERRLKFEGGEK